jgi:hypothetical protein
MKLSSVLCLATAIGTGELDQPSPPLNSHHHRILAVSQAVTWTDEGINFIGKIEEDEGSRFGFVWPSEETSQEFIGQMVVSKTVGWVGLNFARISTWLMLCFRLELHLAVQWLTIFWLLPGQMAMK